MYPNEAEILFAPLTACEVMKTRIDGSTLVVELRPGAAPASLQEKSIEEKEEDDRIEKAKAQKEATARKIAIDEVAKRKAKWMSSMSSLKVSVADLKASEAELVAARETAKSADLSVRAEKAEEEAIATAKNLKAMRQMKQMEAEERHAAEQKRLAEVAMASKLQKAKDMGEYIKKAALKQRLKEEQDALKKEVETAAQNREIEAQQRDALAARLMATAISSTKAKNSASGEADELSQKLSESVEREAQLTEKLAQSSKRAMLAENKMRELQQQLDEANEKYKMDDIQEMARLKDPLDMGEKLEEWLGDSKTVATASARMNEMCKKDAKTNRNKLMSVGAIEKVVRAMDANPGDSLTQEGCCLALGLLTAVAEGKKRAADAGAIISVVRATKTLQRAPLKALFNLTSGDEKMLDMAREAGAKEDWLISTGGDGAEDPESPGKPGMKKGESSKTM